MNINRNDACPCGSGKKYKKCCLNKKNVIQIKEIKEERFFQQKHVLVEKMRAYFQSEIPLNQLVSLQEEFNKRSNSVIPTNIREGFFQFWLFFCHRFDNGLRGIEWFYQDQGAKLTFEENVMIKRWTGLTLKMVEAVNKKDNIILFEDILYHEHFTVLDTRENIPALTPWYGTIGLLENFDGHDYFNGVRIFKGPTNLMNAVKFVREVVKNEKQDINQVLFEFYPEIMRALLEENVEQVPEEIHMQEIDQHLLEYKILSEPLLEKFFQENREFIVDKREGNRKTLSWAGNWKEYKDSELAEGILIAEVFAAISIENGKLLINCFDKQKSEELQTILKKAILAIKFVSVSTKTFEIPNNAMIKNSFVQMSKDTPHYFSLYAQTDLLKEIEIPIPKFGQKSIKQLVLSNEIEPAITWLKQVEYNLYQQAMKHTENVEVTVDINTIRKELGLPLSSFVTGGENRQTHFVEIGNPYQKVVVEKEDIPYFEDLGFKPSNIENFYASDLVTFYKEKTIGKGESTVKKYRNSLNTLRELLESMSIQSWEDCQELFWEKLLEDSMLETKFSKSFQKDFLSTMKTLTKWIDSQETISISPSALKAIKAFEAKRQDRKILQKV